MVEEHRPEVRYQLTFPGALRLRRRFAGDPDPIPRDPASHQRAKNLDFPASNTPRDPTRSPPIFKNPVLSLLATLLVQGLSGRVSNPSQFFRDVRSLGMRVAFQHRPRLMSSYRGDFLQTKTAFEQPTGRLVSQVVPAEAFDLQVIT